MRFKKNPVEPFQRYIKTALKDKILNKVALRWVITLYFKQQEMILSSTLKLLKIHLSYLDLFD